MAIADTTQNDSSGVPRQKLDDVVVRFAGDSGDGMQLTGGQFTSTSALLGNDLATLPDFPAEIRAPAGTLAGVSAFQVRIADYDIHTPGDAPDVLVAMNPAALVKNLPDLKPNGVGDRQHRRVQGAQLRKAGLETDPLEDGTLDGFRRLQGRPHDPHPAHPRRHRADVKEKDRCKNFFALGLVYWLFNRPMESTIAWLEKKFAGKPDLADANIRVLKAGWNYADIHELFQARYEVLPAQAPARHLPQHQRQRGPGPRAGGREPEVRPAALPGRLPDHPGLRAAARAWRSYKSYGVTTFQAEDEIAAVCAAIGASFGGSLGVTGVERPGHRAQGRGDEPRRHGGAAPGGLRHPAGRPVHRPADQDRAVGPPPGAVRPERRVAGAGGRRQLAPGLLLGRSRGRAASPFATWCRWCCSPTATSPTAPSPGACRTWRTCPTSRRSSATEPEGFAPYMRDEETLARPWALPGTPGLEHRIGGLEKQDVTGNVSYDPANHERMTHLRAEKVERVARDIPELEVEGDLRRAKLLVLGWGSTEGAIHGAVRNLTDKGHTGLPGAPALAQPVPVEPGRRALPLRDACWSPR